MSIQDNFYELALSHVPFVQSAESYPDYKLAVTDIEAGKAWTFKEFNRDINKLAHAFQEVNFKKGDVVMASMLNGSDFILATYATFKTGAIFSPINFRIPEADVAYHIEDSQPKIYLYDEELKDIARPALERSRHKPQLVISTAEFGNLMKDKPETEPKILDGITPFDEALRLYTSGTTGKAKGVPLSHLANYMTYFLLSVDGMDANTRFLDLSPYFHRAGGHPFMACLGFGSHVFAMKHFDPRVALDTVEKEKITFIIGAPPMFAAMIMVMREGAKQGKKWDVSSLNGIDSMGAPLVRSLYQACKEMLTENIFNSDGNTETGWDIKQYPWAPSVKWAPTPVMNGISCPFHFVRVVKAYSDKKAEPDEIVPRDGKTEGEMIVKSLLQDDHYHNQPDQTAKAFYKGWYYTGDVVTWDKDGYFAIRSRTGDMILSGAENIYPEEVEAILNEHPKVADSVVVGVPDEVMGEKVGAYVMPKDPSLTVEELDQYMAQHPTLARFKRPRYYKFIREVHYTATGKKIHYELRDQIKADLENGELKAL